jgi:DNA-directed RNA polymerase specialized sigma24 family protein
MDEKTLTELVKATRAVMLVQLQALANPEDRDKPEIVLARAGFSAREIAELINKKPDAVAKALQRRKKA